MIAMSGVNRAVPAPVTEMVRCADPPPAVVHALNKTARAMRTAAPLEMRNILPPAQSWNVRPRSESRVQAILGAPGRGRTSAPIIDAGRRLGVPEFQPPRIREIAFDRSKGRWPGT